MKRHIHITRWALSFAILTIYTSFLVTTDSRIAEYRAEAKSIVSEQRHSPFEMFRITWERKKVCARTNQGKGCGRTWFMLIPVIIHIS